MSEARSDRVTPVASLQEFFKNSVTRAMARQRVKAADLTAYYVVNLLTLFGRSEQLFDREDGSVGLKPLAAVLAQAVATERAEERRYALQRIGDVSLFVAGFLGESLARRLVGIDYYVQMGGSAYSSLAESVRGSARGRALSGVFGELAEKFRDFVDVLGEVRDAAHGNRDQDVLHLYELWLTTGSRRAARLLRRAGIEPNDALDARTRH
jgi:hypothetical protein